MREANKLYKLFWYFLKKWFFFDSIKIIEKISMFSWYYLQTSVSLLKCCNGLSLVSCLAKQVRKKQNGNKTKFPSRCQSRNKLQQTIFISLKNIVYKTYFFGLRIAMQLNKKPRNKSSFIFPQNYSCTKNCTIKTLLKKIIYSELCKSMSYYCSFI